MLEKIKEEVMKQFNSGFLAITSYPQWVANVVPMPKHGQGVNAIDVVSATEDVDSSHDIDNWIFPTTNGGPSNWTAKDFVLFTFDQK